MTARPITFHVPGKVKPKIRWGKERWSARVAAYKASQDEVRHVARQHVPTPWPLRGVCRLGVAWYVEPVKGAQRPPKNCGDWEGVFGAVADALQKSRDGLPSIISGDDLTCVVGPADAMVLGSRQPSGGYVVGTHGTTEPGVWVTLWPCSEQGAGTHDRELRAEYHAEQRPASRRA